MLNSDELDLFKKQLLNSFSDFSCLNDNHTLAACDYYDTYKHFPEERIAHSEFEMNLDGWDQQTKMELVDERRSNIVTNKRYHWTEVEPYYMEKHWSGIYHCKPEEFKFYLAAWMFLYFAYSENMGVISSCFFTALENLLDDKTPAEITLSDNQKKTVATFMLSVVQANTSESDEAKQCLDMGWWYNLEDDKKNTYLSI
jgi:hypothetical protein